MTWKRRRLALLALAGALSITACTSPAAHHRRSAGASPASTGPAPVQTPAAPSTPPATSPRDACVAATVQKLTLAQLVGQTMLVGAPVNDITSVSGVLTRYQFGGVFLAG